MPSSRMLLHAVNMLSCAIIDMQPMSLPSFSLGVMGDLHLAPEQMHLFNEARDHVSGGVGGGGPRPPHQRPVAAACSVPVSCSGAQGRVWCPGAGAQARPCSMLHAPHAPPAMPCSA
jgi:hypothetical protein